MSLNVQFENKTEEIIYQTSKAYEIMLRQVHFSAITKFSILAMQGAFILNSTVGVAAFSVARQESSLPVLICAAGALCAVLAACFSYFAQYQFFDKDLSTYNRYVFLQEPIVFSEEVFRQQATSFQTSLVHTRASKDSGSRCLRVFRSFWFCVVFVCVLLSILLFCIGLFQTVQQFVK